MRRICFFLNLTVTFLLFSNHSAAQNHAVISFSSNEYVGHQFKIDSYSPLKGLFTTLFQTELNGSELKNITVPLKSPAMLLMKIEDLNKKNKRQETIYVEPGDSLKIALKDSVWSIEGKPGLFYQHWARIRGVDRERHQVFEEFYNYTKRIDSTGIKTAFQQLARYREEINREIEADSLLTEKNKKLLFKRNQAPELGFEVFLKTLDILTPTTQLSKKNRKAQISFRSIPENLIDRELIFAEFRYYQPFHTYLLAVTIESMNRHYLTKDQRSIYDYLKSEMAENPTLSKNSDIFLGYILASNSVIHGKNHEEISEIYTPFFNDYPDSPYENDLKEILKGYEPLRAGNPARDFTLTSPEEKPFSLSDFKGKLV